MFMQTAKSEEFFGSKTRPYWMYSVSFVGAHDGVILPFVFSYWREAAGVCKGGR